MDISENSLNPFDPISPSEIGFDIDGVVADTMEAFIRVAREEFGINHIKKRHMTCYWLEECLPMPRDMVTAVIDRLLTDPFGVGLEPIPGARETLMDIGAHGRLTFVTARPIKGPIEAWLASLLPEMVTEDIRVIATGSHAAKAGVIKKLGLRYFIDDHLETCQDLYSKGIGAVVFDQPWNREYTPFFRITSWKDLPNIKKVPLNN